jgi:serine/threonine protein kinase
VKQHVSDALAGNLIPGTRLGPYAILELLGAGGMEEVHRARDTRLDRTVAIKVLPADVAADPRARARFDREAGRSPHSVTRTSARCTTALDGM